MLKFSRIDILNFAMCSARQLLDALTSSTRFAFKHKTNGYLNKVFSKEDFVLFFAFVYSLHRWKSDSYSSNFTRVALRKDVCVFFFFCTLLS